MKTLSSVTRAKIAKVLPLLASDKPGEVLAAVAATRRSLAADQCDLHDLARAVATPAGDVSAEERTPAAAHTLRKTIEECRERWDHLRRVERTLVRRIEIRLARAQLVSPEMIVELEGVAILCAGRTRKFRR